MIPRRDLGGRFSCPWDVQLPSASALERLRAIRALMSVPAPDADEVRRELPVSKPDFRDWKERGAPGTIQVAWLGHATLLVQMDGVTFLTDPVFSDRCSPLSWLGPLRYVAPPCRVEDLPPVDFVLISHSHYDHLDVATVRALQQHNATKWYVPSGLRDWMLETGVSGEQCEELTWWEERRHGQVVVACTPAQHFSGRTPFDRDRTLWASWAVLGATRRFFFGGDTAYCDVFKRIGEKYGPFHLAALPIGAYEPNWFLSCHHVNPAEAVQIHQDVRAERSVAVHWGTFPLSTEHFLAPKRDLERALRAQRIAPSQFFTMGHGCTASLA